MNLRDRLRNFWSQPSLRKLAPTALLTGTIAAGLGALLVPGVAATGLGVIAGGLAVNLASNVIQKLIDAHNDDEREDVLVAALESGDPDANKLAAGLLLQTGPDLLPALPLERRDTLLASLEQAMQQYGGSLAAIAPRYVAALRAGHDMAMVAAELRPVAEQASQVMEATEGGVIEQSRQYQEGPVGSQQMTARGKDSALHGNTQIQVGRTGQAPSRCPDCGSPITLVQAVCGICGQRLAGG